MMYQCIFNETQLNVLKYSAVFYQKYKNCDSSCIEDLIHRGDIVDSDGKVIDSSYISRMKALFDYIFTTLLDNKDISYRCHFGHLFKDEKLIFIDQLLEYISNSSISTTIVFNIPSNQEWTKTSFGFQYQDIKLTNSEFLNRFSEKHIGYQFNFSLDQLRYASKILDTYSRILIGQYNELKEDFMHSTLHYGSYDLIDHGCILLKKEIGFDSNASHGIYSEKISSNASESWTLHKTLRHFEYLTRTNERNGFSVSGDNPIDNEYIIIQNNSLLSDLSQIQSGHVIQKYKNLYHIGFDNQYSSGYCLSLALNKYIANQNIIKTPISYEF